MSSDDHRKSLSPRIPLDIPVPPQDLAEAQVRMIEDMHGNTAFSEDLTGDLEAARQLIDRQNSRVVSLVDVVAGRLEAEDYLDWLRDPVEPSQDLNPLEPGRDIPNKEWTIEDHQWLHAMMYDPEEDDWYNRYHHDR